MSTHGGTDMELRISTGRGTLFHFHLHQDFVYLVVGRWEWHRHRWPNGEGGNGTEKA